MKTTLILAAALPLFVSLSAAQDTPPEKQPAKDKDAPAEKETVRKAAPAAWLGVAMSEDGGEVQLDQVLPDSPAAKAGLKPGDVLLSIGDRAIEGDPSRVAGQVGERKPGDTIALRIRRGDKEETIKVELAERPAPKDEFRGEFRRKTDEGVEKARKELEGVKEKAAEAKEHFKKEFKENLENDVKELDKRVKEKVKETQEGAAKLKDNLKKKFDGKLDKDPDQWKKLDELKMPENQWLKKLSPEDKLLKREEKRFEYRFGPDGPEMRLEKMPSKPGAEEREFRLFMGKPDKAQEEAVWKRVEDSVGRALKESGLGPDVIEKAMNAVREARKNGPEQEARRAKLKAEAARIEKEMQALRDRADRLRDELNKSGE